MEVKNNIRETISVILIGLLGFAGVIASIGSIYHSKTEGVLFLVVGIANFITAIFGAYGLWTILLRDYKSKK